ncbi:MULTISPECIES: signal peptidase II [Prosthecochloris]|uniref:Lipoprotein signal peptidase n=1 Tax=Prosthecochloris vibrioformis TaxID=1098 RepID=A0A5C4S4M9_PROVB|nr:MULTISPECIES: signal peptidase II [Prosthecochloris]ANT65550.1 Lipoprotein signal peptidase [Prosthecochloris sp. CIB 2401]TNJ38069.1 signal peptidase II [Prosthecochloris vibrioformis]
MQRIFSLTAVVILLDQATKQLARVFLRDTERQVTLVADWLQLTYVENPGIAFGVTPGSRFTLVAMTFVILLGILFYVIRSSNRNPEFMTAFGLILGGGLGNLIDRTLIGRVVDFIHFDLYNGYLFNTWVSLWPVFNIADSAITIGAAWLVFRYTHIFNEQ